MEKTLEKQIQQRKKELETKRTKMLAEGILRKREFCEEIKRVERNYPSEVEKP